MIALVTSECVNPGCQIPDSRGPHSMIAELFHVSGLCSQEGRAQRVLCEGHFQDCKGPHAG